MTALLEKNSPTFAFCKTILKTTIKKITASSFILLGFAPVLFTAFFVLKQRQIRHRMKEQMEIQQLHTILLASDEVVWVKAGKEILLDGKLFDIKLTEQKNGIITFQGLFDEEETYLIARQQMNQEEESNDNTKILASFFGLFEISPENNNSVFVVYTKNKQRFPCYTSSLSAVFSSVITPPPRAGDVDNTSA